MVSVNKFRANLKKYVDQAIENHEPVTVNRKNGDAFVVISQEDYKREQETLYILNNNSLMSQIKTSIETFNQNSGFAPTDAQLGFEQ